MKHKRTIGVLCCCVLALAGGCRARTEKPVQPEEQMMTKEQTPEEETQPEVPEVYEDLIAAARECVIRNDGEKPEEYDFSSMLFMKKDWDYGTLGYLLLDLDGNGTKELIFGGNMGESGEWYDGIVYDIYTVADGELVHVLDGWERNRYFLCGNGIIANEWADSAFEGGYTYFVLEGSGLRLIESITERYEEENGDSGQVYYYSTESQFDTSGAEVISQEQAMEIIDGYAYEHPVFIPFAPE